MILATHSGKFHADDVFASALLKNIFPDAKIIRTRDADIIDKADIVYDVGGVYNPLKQRFDHHQNLEITRKNGILYSSFGLLWIEYGIKFCDNNKDAASYIEKRLVEVVDAIDNGQDIYIPNSYNTPTFEISDLIGIFNPVATLSQSKAEDFDSQFEKALILADFILNRLKKKAFEKIEADNYFLLCYKNSPNKAYCVLDKYIPHSSIAIKQTDLLFTVFPNTSNGWSIKTVPIEKGSFASRKDLPKEWAGLQGKPLQDLLGIPEAVFAHKARFIAGASSKEAALKMMHLALQ